MSLRQATISILLFLSFLSLTACKEDTKTAKGEAGESCTRRQDCGSGLSCIDNRCVSEEDSQTADGGMAATSGGKAGESCTRRADCQAGLACVDQVCQTEMLPAMGDAGVPGQRGERGETCTARNDCKAGLGCVGGRCRENEYNLTVQPNECFRVECEATADCCQDFVPSLNCPTLKSECDLGDAFSCQEYASDCNCNFVCEESLCAFKNSCVTSNDCNFARPVCTGQKCVQCALKADCADPSAECVAGVCREACTRNEQCPLFFSCDAGKCVDTGCKTDRECYFATQDPRSTCVETKCVTPCDTDSECLGDFNVCDKGRCIFVGCENNEECRAMFRLQNVVDSEKAVCRAPTM